MFIRVSIYLSIYFSIPWSFNQSVSFSLCASNLLSACTPVHTLLRSRASEKREEEELLLGPSVVSSPSYPWDTRRRSFSKDERRLLALATRTRHLLLRQDERAYSVALPPSLSSPLVSVNFFPFMGGGAHPLPLSSQTRRLKRHSEKAEDLTSLGGVRPPRLPRPDYPASRRLTGGQGGQEGHCGLETDS